MWPREQLHRAIQNVHQESNDNVGLLMSVAMLMSVAINLRVEAEKTQTTPKNDDGLERSNDTTNNSVSVRDCTNRYSQHSVPTGGLALDQYRTQCSTSA
jgi:hypothetical protein